MHLLSYVNYLKNKLNSAGSIEKAQLSQRYLPNDINCVGATAFDIKKIIAEFHIQYPNISSEDSLTVCEYIIKHAKYNEEILIAFGLINKFVAKHYDDTLLLRFEYWLEHNINNWSQVDDLCIKTIFRFLMARPHLIDQTQHWAYSHVSWCRRASNVVWVKFIKRKIGTSVYYLNKELIFKNCNTLINDKDPFVQKSIGWLLKVASLQYEDDVIRYIEENGSLMTRPTIRYALEKLNTSTRKRLLTETKIHSP